MLRRVREITALGFGQIRAKLPNIRNTWQGGEFSEPSKKHAVYVHFDEEGEIFDFILKALADLRECGYAITFVTNSPRFPQGSLDAVRPHVRLIIQRYNSGYDFAAYRDGIHTIPDLQGAEALIIMNDSVYGPLYSLKNALASIDPEKVDVWGITDSWEYNFHIQTYFVLFFNKAITSNAFTDFWKNFPNINDKWTVIRNGELKLTRKLVRERLRIEVQCPFRKMTSALRPEIEKFLDEENEGYGNAPKNDINRNLMEMIAIYDQPFNASHLLWETAITDWNCLFLKRELIQKNPIKVPYVWRWRQVLEEHTDYDPELIEQHLRSL